MKHLTGVRLKKHVQDLYGENWKTLMKINQRRYIDIFQINGGTFHVHRLEDLILLICQFFPTSTIDSI